MTIKMVSSSSNFKLNSSSVIDILLLWLLIWWSLKIYIVINFRTHEISRDARKLTRIYVNNNNNKKNKQLKLIIWWLLTLELVKLVKMHATWPESTLITIKKKKTIEVLVLKVKLDYDVSKMCPRNYNWWN
jgi:hypothetical protein